MAEPEEDKVLERYRALGRDEPPPELDARILDAARRAAAVRPVRRRWVLPASIAAVVVLSVSVALKVERERAAPAPAAPSASDNLMRAPTLERKLQENPAGSAAQAGRPSAKSA